MYLKKGIICLLLFVAVGAFDYFTGYEISSYPIYLMPIFLAFFYFGKNGGYLACVISAVMWTTIDIADNHHFTHELARYWAMISRMGIYLLFVYGLSIYTQTVEIHRRRLEEIRRLIPMCHGCGKVLWWDGTWKTPEETITLGTEIPECPTCAGGKSDLRS